MGGNLLTAHCLIRNEEKWVWYAINSVLDHVDKILVFDTGSTDRTVEIVKSIVSPKIVFAEKGKVDKCSYTKLRQEMLDRTSTLWFMVLDGDEVWPEKAIKELTATIRRAPSQIEGVMTGQWICQGDVFHYSSEAEKLINPKTGKRGFWLPRAWRTIPGLHTVGVYGIESYADKNDLNVSDWDKRRFMYLHHKFFHMTFLPRSSSRKKDREVMLRSPKTHFTIGSSFPAGTKYPEVFYAPRPAFVPSPWRRFTRMDQAKGYFYRVCNLIDRYFLPAYVYALYI